MIIDEPTIKDNSIFYTLSNSSENTDELNNDENPIFHNYKYRRSRKLSRYNNAFKNLIPIRHVPTSDVMGVDSAGFFSSLSFSWLTKYLMSSYRNNTSIIVPKISPQDTADRNAKRLEALWNEEVGRHSLSGASFSRAAWRFIRTRVIMTAIIFGLSIVLGFVASVIIMKKLLEYIESQNDSLLTGFFWIFLLTILNIIKSSLFSWGWSCCYRTGLRLKSAFLTVMYKKLINVNNLGNKDSGRYINMLGNDAQSAFDLCIFTPMMVAGPLVAVLIFVYILYSLSSIALLGFLFFFLFYPTQYLLSRLTGYFKKKSISSSDERISAFNEIVNGIKLLKMYAWEDPFSLNLAEFRNKEKKWLEKMSVARSYASSLTVAFPVISAIITFLAHVSSGHNLTSAQAFPIIFMFKNQTKICLSSFRDGPRQIIEAKVSFDRIKVFPFVLLLNTQTRHMLSFFEVAVSTIVSSKISFNRIKMLLSLDENICFISKPIIPNQAISIISASFVCDLNAPEFNSKKVKNEKGIEELESLIPKRIEILKDITFEAAKCSLIGICGSVGSGKSSLLKAALGQLRISSGKIARDGSCAYVSQQPWILNTTFKENIIFGNKFNAKRYYSAISLCCLQEDLDLLPANDDTEIGERGINLSGGQKQRLSLARAYYSNQDIYFLDDPLSAVDSNVGWYIFENLICKALKDKTIIFVTHQIQYLSYCNQIYMMNNGKIVEHGDHVALIRRGKEYALMVKNTSLINHNVDYKNTDNKDNHCDQLKDSNEENDETDDANDGSLMVPEVMESGDIKLSTYLTYLNAMGGWIIASFVLANILMNTASMFFTNWWLAKWIEAGSGGMNVTIGNETVVSENITDNPRLWFYQTVYGASIGIIILLSLIRGFVLTKATLNAATKLHNKIFKTVVNSSIQFFERTPKGRLQNIFSRDIAELDSALPLSLENVLNNIFHGLINVIAVCYISPYLIVPFILLTIIFYCIASIFRRALRDLRRNESISRSPIFSAAVTTLQGLDTIHAFKKEQSFIQKFYDHVDLNAACEFFSNILLRWAAIRLDFLTIIAYSCTGMSMVLLKGHISPGIAGLALTLCGQMTGFLQYTIRLISQTEIKFISVERINYYLMNLKDENDNTKSPSNKLISTINNWPSIGTIEFKNIVLKYRKNSPVILNNLSFKVNAGEKIGICGRTGSGKSSLVAGLFRLVELTDGIIEIDGIDISTINLKELRSKLSIIPQDPTIFNGTIRFNLDPCNLNTDDELWISLEKTKLKDKVMSMPGQLNAIIDSGTSKMSTGECQLLCLARALLRKNKIFILDEATASVDPQTEVIVQSTIQNEFSQCTMLIIAHRLQTILNCNRIIVIDAGKILEIDTPVNLLENKQSHFYKMYSAAK